MKLKIDLDRELETVFAYHVAWEQEKAKLAELIAYCHAQHETPPPNYWQVERAAEQKYRLAALTYEALTGIDRGGR